MTNEERLKELTNKVNAAKELKIKAEARLAELERQEREIREKLKARGFDPERLAAERATREQKLAELLNQAQAILDGQEPAPVQAVQPEPNEPVIPEMAEVSAERKRPVRSSKAPAMPAVDEDIPW